MTVRPAVVLARLAHLGFVLGQLERLRVLRAEGARDPLHDLGAERALHVAAEALFDIGHHVLAGRGHPVPAVYRDVVPALVAHGILPPELGPRLDGMAGMRNLLVHDYARVDTELLWRVVDDHLADLRAAHAALAALPELAQPS